MNDLIERLHEQADQLRCHPASRGVRDIENAGELMAQAADRIERDESLMRQALDALEQAGQIDTYRNYDMEDDAMKALRERLKC